MLFGNAPTLKAYFVQRLHNRRPVIIPFEEFDIETFATPFGVSTFPAEFLDVQRDDTFAQNPNPLLGPAIMDHIADIKMPADPRALELINETSRFERAEEKIIPNVFNGDLYTQLFGEWQCFANLLLRPIVSVRIGNAFVHDARHQQDRAGAILVSIPQGLFQAFATALSDS